MSNGEKRYPYMLRFARHGFSRYIAHLDWIRIVQTALDRSGLPLIYTEGFAPKAKLKYSPPLPVGLASDCELVLIFLSRNLKPEFVMETLHGSMPDGILITGAHFMHPAPPKNPFQSINGALYEMIFHDEPLDKKKILNAFDMKIEMSDELMTQAKLIVKIVNRDEFIDRENPLEYVAKLEEKQTFHPIKFSIALKNHLNLKHIPEGKKLAFLNIDEKGARKLFQFD